MKDILLYDYQLDMKERIDASFKSFQSVMVQMPTGTGKTYLLASVVFDEIQQSDKANVWIVVHRKELMEQIEETLGRFAKNLLDDDSFYSQNYYDSENSHIKVMSIQWLSRHYKELQDPSLIVIDEAHHAVAKTYAEVMNAYPKAKKLGVTATPCRLRKGGFTDLFDVLLKSWSTKRFIAVGRLSLYDYMSIKADSEDQRSILGLTKRGADGDFSLKEMSEKLDVQPSIERLRDSVLRYASDKKGIVYAIDIKHAEHIVEEYRRYGIKAVAISCKTPIADRQSIIERFKSIDTLKPSETDIQVLVNVDLFGEGFDCPDVEFIQLARPTLSLSKYLQQVGRGMRVFEGKKFCLILDNVGLYRLFGLPSDDHDWQAMFEGTVVGKGNISQVEEKYDVAYFLRSNTSPVTADAQTELITILTHDGQRMDLDATYQYHIIENENGLKGIADNNDDEVLPCIYNKVELKAYGFAKLHSRRKLDSERPWIDLRNGVRFVREPRIEKYGFLELSTSDGTRLYPRVRTRQMNEDCFVLPDALEHGMEDGLQFKNFYIQSSEPETLYIKKDQIDDVTLFENEQGLLAWRKEWNSSLHPTSTVDWDDMKKAHAEAIAKYEEEKEAYIKYFRPKIQIDDIYERAHLSDYEEPSYIRISRNIGNTIQVFYRKSCLDKWESVGSYSKIFPQAYSIRVVQNRDGKYLIRTELFHPLENPEYQYDFAELQDNRILYFTEQGKEYWVCLDNRVCFTRKPEFLSIGFMHFIKVGDVYIECGPYSRETYRRAEIRIYGDICFLGKRKVIVKTKYNKRYFFIQRRNVDGKHFVLSDEKTRSQYETLYDMYYDGKNTPIIKRRKKEYEL